MTPTAARIAKALNVTTCVRFMTGLDGPGAALRGWFALKPAGGWRYLGATSVKVLGR